MSFSSEDVQAPPYVVTVSAPLEELLRDARKGDQVAIGRLLEAANRYLKAIANQTLSDKLRAKLSPSDLAQETSFEAFKDFNSFRGERFEELLAWLRRILLNNVANASRQFERTQKRRLARETSIEDEQVLTDPAPTPSKAMISFEREQALEQALSRLPSEMRATIVLRNREHLAFSEIGIQLNRSPDAARKLWARAIERLHKELS